MGMGQGVVTGIGHGASPVSYRHNFLVFFFYKSAVKTLQITIFCKILSTECMTKCSIGVQYQSNTCCKAVSLSGTKVKWLEQLSYCAQGSRFK